MSKSARISWRLRHKALKSIHKGAILPQLIYAVPVGIDAIKNKYNTGNYVKVQRLNSLRIAKAYRTISHEALCIMTGLTSISIKGEDVATLYNITTGRNNQKYQIDKEENPSSWLLPAEMFRLNGKNTKARNICGIISRAVAKANKELGQG